MDESIQRLLDSGSDRLTELPGGEFEGPFVVKRPCFIVGNTTTLWAKSGPVLTVDSPGVSLKNIRLEVTDEKDGLSILSSVQDTHAEGVEIAGGTEGFCGEDGFWDIPDTLELGEFPSNRQCSFRLEVRVPVKCSVRALVKDVTVSPETLEAGKNILTVVCDRIRKGTYLYGDILLISSFTRRIFISGAAKEKPENYTEGRMLYTAVKKDTPLAGGNMFEEEKPVEIAPDALVLKRGMRTPLGDWEKGSLTILLEYSSKLKEMEIDPYVFLLDEKNRAAEDWRLVFFGNTVSRDGAVRVLEENVRSTAALDLQRVSMDTGRIAISYAIYGNKRELNFSKVKNPVVKIWEGGRERMVFPIDSLTEETTVIALELYRYKGIWKVSAVGGGYRDGIKRLCESYGLEIMEE